MILPLKVSGPDKKALTDLQETIKSVQAEENPDLTVAAAVLTDWSKSKHAPQIAATVRGDYPDVMIALARRNVKAAAGLHINPRSQLANTGPARAA
ncbi:hypothetical protein [Streptomyces sp. NPDC020298]|uniref:ParA family protein n=1 Tax=unclassified Streptomyces TaxID=2593676 RepID=UPI0033C6942B